MRLIGSVYTPDAVTQLDELLERNHIVHTIEPHTVTDWSLPTYGDRSWMVWILNEEDLPKAQALYEQFLEQHDPLTPASHPHTPSSAPLLPPPSALGPTEENTLMRQPPLKEVTALLIIICLLCFLGSYFLTNPTDRGDFFSTPLIPTDPVKKTLLYDFPPYYAFVNQLIQTNWRQRDKEITEQELEVYSKELEQSFQSRPVWMGYYAIALAYLHGEPWEAMLNAPRFEKIKQGEVWRIVSPIFLHQNLLHLLFNLLWVYLLGRQLEFGLGPVRYILFCLIVAAVSNTAQYLVSGPNFLGISGLVCGMVTYIWLCSRQERTLIRSRPRTYFLTPGTFQGLFLFVCALFAIQALSFLLEATKQIAIPVGVANTAHIVGGLTGALLATFAMCLKANK